MSLTVPYCHLGRIDTSYILCRDHTGDIPHSEPSQSENGALQSVQHRSSDQWIVLACEPLGKFTKQSLNVKK